MNSFGEKGQSSFEMVIIASMVTLLAFISLSGLPRRSSTTGAISILKSEALEVLSAQDQFYFIEQVHDPTVIGGTSYIDIYIGGSNIANIEGAISDKHSVIVDLNVLDELNVNVIQATQ